VSKCPRHIFAICSSGGKFPKRSAQIIAQHNQKPAETPHRQEPPPKTPQPSWTNTKTKGRVRKKLRHKITHPSTQHWRPKVDNALLHHARSINHRTDHTLQTRSRPWFSPVSRALAERGRNSDGANLRSTRATLTTRIDVIQSVQQKRADLCNPPAGPNGQSICLTTPGMGDLQMLTTPRR